MWGQSSLDYRQRLQELFFPEGISFDGKRFNRTALTATLFKYLEPGEQAEESIGVPTGSRRRVEAAHGLAGRVIRGAAFPCDSWARGADVHAMLTP